MSGSGREWYKFFSKLADIRLTYGQLKADEENRNSSTALGGRAIFYDVLYAIFMTFGVLGVVFGLRILNDTSVIVGLLVLIFGIAFVAGSVLQIILALFCAFYQLRLNKRAIGWVTLVISVLLIVGGAVALIFGISL